MDAWQLNDSDVIINRIVVDSLDVLPNLVNASIGGKIGDSVINGVLIPAPPIPPVVNMENNAIIVTQSFNSALRRKAATLQQQGSTFEAVQLLLQAQGVQS